VESVHWATANRALPEWLATAGAYIPSPFIEQQLLGLAAELYVLCIHTKYI